MSNTADLNDNDGLRAAAAALRSSGWLRLATIVEQHIAEVETLRQTLDRRQALHDADSGRGYRADVSLDDIRCDVLDTGWPLGDDTDPERTPRRLVREVLAELAHVRDQRDNLQAACDRLRANADTRERFLRRQGDLLRAAERDAEDAERGAAACDQIVALLDGIPVEAPCPEAARVAALVAELERLREEVAHLRACVPPARPSDYGHEAWAETVRAAVGVERAVVVAYLGFVAEEIVRDCCSGRVSDAADAIERGEHREGER